VGINLLKEHIVTLTSILGSALHSVISLVVRPASAHCDTEDGPAAVDGRRALESGNVNIALKWVRAVDESEVRESFEQARRVRSLDGEASEAADREFLETLVRVHRAGEGAGFEGIKPVGTPIPAQVSAADRALEEGSIEPLRGLIDAERWAELEHRFEHALGLKGFDDDDLAAARTYMDAYVSFFKYAEGHDHAHHGHDEHAHH